MARLARLLATAVLAAGVVGLVRQRRERDALRRGELPRAPAGTLLAPPEHASALAGRFARWEPARPASLTGRIAVTLWAAPLSVVGLAFGLLGGGRPRWDATHGCLVFEGTGGLSGRALEAVGAGANAVGHVVLSRHEHTPPALLAHEAAHVRQAERLGPLLLPVYVLWQARYGYRHNPVERGARRRALREQAGRTA